MTCGYIMKGFVVFFIYWPMSTWHECYCFYDWPISNTPGDFFPTVAGTDGRYDKWRHGMETPSSLLALCEGNPSVTDGFPSQKVSNAELWCVLCWGHEQTVDQAVEVSVILVAMDIWYHCNVERYSNLTNIFSSIKEYIFGMKFS